MNAPRCSDADYIAFLLAAQRVYSCTEAARCQPAKPRAPAHDAFTRLLTRVPPDTATLWDEARRFVRREEGLLVLDDTTLDKPYAKRMDLVTRHWSGKHKSVVWGINLQTLVWSGFGESDVPCVIPCDLRLYQATGPTKNEQMRQMLTVAHERGFTPECVLFDSWYSGLDNLKAIRALGWTFLTRLRSNRIVDVDRTGHVPVSEVATSVTGRVVWLKGFGEVRLFRTESPDGHAEYWATNDTGMSAAVRAEYELRAWGIESYHRSLKQYCGASLPRLAGSARRRDRVWHRQTTCCFRRVRICAWRCTGCERGRAISRRRLRLRARRSAHFWLGQALPGSQLRNS